MTSGVERGPDVPHPTTARLDQRIDDTDVELLPRSEQVHRLVRELTDSSRHTIVSLMTSVPTFRDVQNSRAQLTAIRRGVTMLCVLPDTVSEHPGTLEACIEAVAVGSNIRVLDEVPMTCLIFDNEIAIVSRVAGSARDGAWVLRTPDLVEPIAALADTAWTQGTPLAEALPAASALPAAAAARAGRQSPPSPNNVRPESVTPLPSRVVARSGVGAYDESRVREVYLLLGQGHKDDAISRRMGISVRTVRRLVACGMEILGVDSRFEAGAQAARRGWLDQPPGA